MKKSNTSLGQLIKNYRIKADMTQKDFATQLGYDIPQFISLMENGHAKIPLNILGKVIAILKIPEKTVLEILSDSYKKEVMNQISNSRKKAENH